MDLKPSWELSQLSSTPTNLGKTVLTFLTFLFFRSGILFGILFPFYFSDWTLKVPVHTVFSEGSPLLGQLKIPTLLPSMSGCSENVWRANTVPSLPLALFGCLVLLSLYHRCLKFKSKILKERRSNVSSVSWLLANIFLYKCQCHWHRMWLLLKLKVLP